MKKVKIIKLVLASITSISLLVKAFYNHQFYLFEVVLPLLLALCIVSTFLSKNESVKKTMFYISIPVFALFMMYFAFDCCFNLKAIFLRMSGNATSPESTNDLLYFFSTCISTALVNILCIFLLLVYFIQKIWGI